MINVAILPFNAFQENTYILSDETKSCVIVDPGNTTARENAAISKYIENNGLKPVMIVNTHGHVDHLLGVDYLKESYHIAFGLHRDDLPLVEKSPMQGRMYGFDLEKAPVVDVDLAGEKSIRFGDSELEIIHTPGHSPGHISLYNKENKILLTGDVLFMGSIGRTDLPGGDYKVLMESIISKIIPLGSDVNIFPGHGRPSTIGQELETNPFITEVIEGDVNF